MQISSIANELKPVAVIFEILNKYSRLELTKQWSLTIIISQYQSNPEHKNMTFGGLSSTSKIICQDKFARQGNRRKNSLRTGYFTLVINQFVTKSKGIQRKQSQSLACVSF